MALEECSAESGSQVGGKAAGLGTLLQGGLDVPPGFVVTTRAYATATGELRDEIAERLAPAGSRAGDAKASAEIQALFSASVLPESVADEIVAAYQALGSSGEVPVAVRSSATAEDTADASFAGQQDTYLWVRGAEAVCEHVVRCWASLFTPQAIGYRSRLAAIDGDLAMAVVVQQMIPAEAAGVMMTLDPVTGDRSRIVIESSFGLGEIVVRGEVTPDRFAVDKLSLETCLQQIATKERAYEFDPALGEVRQTAVPADRQGLPSLEPSEVRALADLGRRIEELFEVPMDIEWAVATAPSGRRQMHLLQARPETVWSRMPPVETLEDVRDRCDEWDPLMDRSAPDVHWTTSNVGEAMPGILTPLAWSMWGRAGELCLREGGFAVGVLSAAERIVPTNIEDRLVRIFYGRGAMQVEYIALVGERMPGTTPEEAVTSVFGRVPDDMRFTPTRRRWAVIAFRLPLTFVTFPRRLARMTDEYDPWWRDAVERVPALDHPAAVAMFCDARRRFDEAMALQSVGVFGVVQPLFDGLSRLVEWAGAGDVGALSGAGGAEMEVVSDIWNASRERMTVEDVVRKHGFHGPGEGELSSRVWRDDSRPLRKIVQQYAERDDTHDPADHEAERHVAASNARREVLIALPRRVRLPARMLLKLARERIPLRGVAKRSFLQAYDVARASARRIGEHLVASGAIDAVDDVFYLTADEITGHLPGDARTLIDRRRARRDVYARLTLPGDWTGMPEPSLVDGTSPDVASGDVLTGIGVSPGVVEGVVRVVMNPDFVDVQPDEILVAPSTDPSWSSIMFISSALIVDIGGALSHAAVVAREMRIPCVVNTRSGTRTLHTGDRVRVDGARGTIEVLSEPTAAQRP